MSDTLTNEIDKLLPQTQCGQCGYGGCLPYAKAIAAQGEEINRCPPGGVKTLLALGKLVGRDTGHLLPTMQAEEKPPQIAKIRATECIGCTKCIKACPVDAIIGAAKQLHFILENECTGCGLCVAPCPVDCIDLIRVEQLQYDPQRARERFNARQQRAENFIKQKTTATSPVLKPSNNIEDKKAYIKAAILRAKQKKDRGLT